MLCSFLCHRRVSGVVYGMNLRAVKACDGCESFFGGGWRLYWLARGGRLMHGNLLFGDGCDSVVCEWGHDVRE